ncbi:MAG: TIGR02186 family protein [Gammaproteobacteria bacterium]
MSPVLRLLGALWCVLLASGASAAGGDELVTQLGTHHVEITARFTGQDVLIFGAVSHPGDVIIKVISPHQTVDLSRKARYGPFWLTSGKFTVRGTPGLLYVLSTRPVADIVGAAQRSRYGLDLADVLEGVQPSDVGSDMVDWRPAFLGLKERGHYYLQDGHAVKMLGNRLFSASMALPAKLPLGIYHLEIYLVRDGKVVAQQSRKFDVREVRAERWVSNVAYDHSWMFGIAFTLLAMVLGLVLGIVLRRGGDD